MFTQLYLQLGNFIIKTVVMGCTWCDIFFSFPGQCNFTAFETCRSTGLLGERARTHVPLCQQFWWQRHLGGLSGRVCIELSALPPKIPL